MVIGYYGSTLIYQNPYGNKDWNRRYAEGAVISMSAKKLQPYAANINDDVKDSDKGVHHSWLATAVINPLHI